MEISHDEKADNGDDNANKLDFVIRDTSSEFVGDLLVKNGNHGASNNKNNTKEKPTDIEIPIHGIIIH